MKPYKLNRELRIMMASAAYRDACEARTAARKLRMARYVADTPQELLRAFEKYPTLKLLRQVDTGVWYIHYAELPPYPVIESQYEGSREVCAATYKKLLSCARSVDVTERFPELAKYLP